MRRERRAGAALAAARPRSATSMDESKGDELELAPRDGMGPDPTYVCLPAPGRGPCLIPLHDTVGVDERMRALARVYAEEGYVVFLPDLFWLRGFVPPEVAGETVEWESWFYHEGPEPSPSDRLTLEPALEDVEIVLEM